MDESKPDKPTNISYSTLVDFSYCPRFYELMNVKRLAKRESSISTLFGNFIHKLIQKLLEGKIDEPYAIARFHRVWSRFVRMYKLEPVVDFDPYVSIATKIINQINPFFDKHFPGYKTLHTEYKIKHPLLNPQYNFKGYIDLVLVHQNDPANIVIIDFKTANSTEKFRRYQDDIKEHQLRLYKYYYGLVGFLGLFPPASTQHPSIHTYFVILEKQVNSDNPIELAKVSSETSDIFKSLMWMNNITKSIEANRFPQNRLSCLKYGEKHPCIFYKKICK